MHTYTNSVWRTTVARITVYSSLGFAKWFLFFRDHVGIFCYIVLYTICAPGLPRTTESLANQPNSRRLAYGTDKTCREINTTAFCDPFRMPHFQRYRSSRDGLHQVAILSLLHIAHFAMPHCDFASLPELEYPTDEVALSLIEF
jgi:hypothetical protein